MVIEPDNTNVGFDYPPIAAAHRDFRLFTLHGRDVSGLFSGTLRTASLARIGLREKYMALSYEWGGDAPTHRICLNGATFFIRKNLHTFLESIECSERGPACGIFIDALCINRSVISERNSQVRLMPDIYSGAEEVRAWMGGLPAWWTPKPKPSDLFTTVPKREWGNFMFYLLTCRRPQAPLRFSIKQITDWARNSGLDNLTIISARVAAQTPFWSRLWIVQELVLADHLTLQLGDMIIPAQVVMQVSRAMSGHWDDASNGVAAVAPAALMGTRIDAISDGLRFQDCAVILSRKYATSGAKGRLPPHEVLESFAMQQCRDQHDHVFGLLGLCSSAIVADYEISLPQLFLCAIMEAHLHVQEDTGLSALQAGFKAATPPMTAFGWHTTDLTVHLLVNIALEQTGSAEYERHSLMLGLMLWIQSNTLNQRNMPRILRWALETVQLVLLVALPIAAWHGIYAQTGRWSPLVYAYGPTQCAYGAHRLLLILFRYLDWELAGPDGQVRTYSGWSAEVVRVAGLVRNHEPLRPLSREDPPAYYPDPEQQGRKFTTKIAMWSGIIVPSLAWFAGWFVVLSLFYVLFVSAWNLFGHHIRTLLVATIPDGWLSWKAAFAAYIVLRVLAGRGNMMPVQK